MSNWVPFKAVRFQRLHCNKSPFYTVKNLVVQVFCSLPGEGKTTYTFSVSVNTFSIEFPLACYQQAGRVWYVSGALRRTYTLFYPAPSLPARYLTEGYLEGSCLGRVFGSKFGHIALLHWQPLVELKTRPRFLPLCPFFHHCLIFVTKFGAYLCANPYVASRAVTVFTLFSK